VKEESLMWAQSFLVGKVGRAACIMGDRKQRVRRNGGRAYPSRQPPQ
jgi:hypothetical protein